MPSSVVDRIEYNADHQVLTVVFLSGKVYHYKDVPRNVYRSFRAATSKGRYLNKYIKGAYEYDQAEE